MKTGRNIWDNMAVCGGYNIRHKVMDISTTEVATGVRWRAVTNVIEKINLLSPK